MRNLSSVRIADEIEREVAISDETRKLVDTTLEDIATKIIEEDASIIDKLKDEELITYMNVELYTALDDLLELHKTEGFYNHRLNDCPVCEKLHRIEFIIETLISDWERIGKAEKYKDMCRFRCDAIEPGRIIN